MGLFNRQVVTETKVFTPTTPVNLSPGLLSQLVSTKETDFTRQQLNDKFLEEKVSQRFAQREQEVLRKFELNLKEALLAEDNKAERLQTLSSQQVGAKVVELQKRMDQLEGHGKQNEASALADAREQVRSCLAVNRGRPLNCFEEMEAFKRAAL
ncbi:Mic19p Ecym_2718 [Eremothecium cymbalariae DBVPG|uniref:MICOS complex subunit MIC19 n=1 Tax=Eremothecium cymbalariae (strain CBS 270.75 / DBVPG 7215 / KCTC 17166 / NRRL Y-17582) TaxID=931890 RepID=G8JPF6_ERECY|nr:Hypothetical protein Ecym_2718 [Eremothecium cymbalariae DBVPG\